MTKAELIEALKDLPDHTRIYVRHGVDAWPARLRRFKSPLQPERVVYMDIEPRNHLNFPEGYVGVVEK